VLHLTLYPPSVQETEALEGSFSEADTRTASAR